MFALQLVNWGTFFLAIVGFGTFRYFAKGPDDKDRVNWSPLETICITIAIYFVSQVVATAVLFVFAKLITGWNVPQITNWLDSNVYGQFLLILFIETLAVGTLYYFLKRRKSNLKTIGLKRPRWRDLSYVLLGYLVYFGTYLVILSLVKQAIPQLNTDQQQQLGFSNPSHWQLPLVFISLVILPPLVEELLVRGFLYSGLKKGLPMIWAILATSLIFASAHLQPGVGEPLLWSAAIDTFILSLMLIYIKEKTGSLVACIGLHMLKNLVAFMGLFVFHIV